MKLTLPQKTIHKNLLLTSKGDIWAYYKVRPKYIANQNTEQKEQSKELWAYLINSLKDYKDFHLELYPPERDLTAQFHDLEDDLATDNKKIGQYYAKETVRLLENEMGMITHSSFVLGVKLKENQYADDLKEVFKDTYEQVTKRLFLALGYDMETDSTFFDRYEPAEENLFSLLRVGKVIRLEEDEMIYLNRYNFIRDIQHSMEKESRHETIFELSDSILDPTERAGFIKLRNFDGDSYVSFLPIAEFPVNFANNHLFSLAQEMKFPCELHVKAHFEQANGISGLKSKASGKNRKFKVNTKEAVQDGDNVRKSLVQNRAVLQIMQDDLEVGTPILRWFACFVVYGKTLEECKRHGDTLKQLLGVRNIKVFRPLSDQLELFYKLLQGESVNNYKKWIQYSNSYGLSEMLFGVTNMIGNNSGWYIGRVDDTKSSKDRSVSLYGSRKIVLLNPLATNQNIKNSVTASPHITITGQTGKGKSYLIKLLFYYLSFLKLKILYIDPKKELRRWFERVIHDPIMQKKYPMFIEHLKSFHYVTLDASKKENWGTLDPIVFLKGMEAKETAESMIFQLYDTRDKDHIKLAIIRAIREVILQRERGEKVGLLNVIQLLIESKQPDIAAAGELLSELIEDSILRLGFSWGKNDGVSLERRVTILEISGLELPKETDDPEYYSDVERKSICLMLPLGKFCEMFGASNPEEFTVEIFDEAWIFSVAKGGKRVLKSIKRVGRSMSNMCVLVTQSIFDVSDEENKGQDGVIFAFDEASERKEILEHMQIEDTEGNRKWLESMLQGQCLFKDIYGRVGKITVHCLFEEMDKASETIKKSTSGSIEEKYAVI
ncbi:MULTISPECIES: ATP-binding protein [unclassified Enterococcus]|uniref:ATP-binding protein n=1 Tax=unclassified Enterococcus TaxID=2608891 RepID=UPI001903FBEB|nr:MULTISPECIES: ATP-binding protein [unclassified Enterococcus]MBK0036050.1 ATP-binding protein [Enterococcus sp. S52]MBK0068708.1 ATP-binding protein [Enterococcus sp. S53]MBK0139301.1 ATP-binding protein [Enterococcus sp. S76]MBK0142936.1 ATP-binding protein [Enterococcus sp. S77]